MIPQTIPIFKTEHIIPPPAQDYEDSQGRRSTVGWLKHLFLFQHEGEYLIPSTAKDYRDYEEAVKVFKRVNGIKQRENLDDWEDGVNASQQRIALNKFRKEVLDNELFSS